LLTCLPLAKLQNSGGRFIRQRKEQINGKTQINDTNDINVEKAAHIGVIIGIGNNLN